MHLDDGTLQPALFGLLRVVLARRFVLAELYDMMLVLGDMVLQARVRPSCQTPCQHSHLCSHHHARIHSLGQPLT